ncbi:MAG TPA: zinc-ribbon domain-containing protein [Chloroflexi bacterium]|nr:zinc-ribbon domain-containing protein [Chloroflexota bacterium]
MTEIICSTCGKPNTDDQNFCDHCGAPLFSVDPLPLDSPSLRDDLFDNTVDKTPAQFPEPMDEASRLDSLLSPQEPLEKIPEVTPQAAGSLDEFSRLDDLIPAPEPEDGPPSEGGPQPLEESDASSRLDDFFATDNPFTDPEEEKKQPEPPAFDPFLEPSARDQLLGEESPGDTSGGEWEYLTKPSAEDSSLEKTPPVEEPADNLDFLSSLSDDSAPETESPTKESGEEREFLTSPSAEEESTKDPVEDWDFLSSLSSEEEPPKEDPGKSIVNEWDFLSSSSTEEEPAREEEPVKSPVDEWDLTPDAGEEPAKTEYSEPETDTELGLLAALDGEEAAAGPGQPADEPPGDLDYLTPDPDSEPAPIGFRPDLYDEDEDPLPEFGSPGFSDDSAWLDMLQDPESREAAKETPAQPTKPQTDWLDKIKRLNKSSDLVDEDSSFPDWLSVSEKPAEEMPEEVKPPEDSHPPADSDEAAPANDLPAWLKIDGDDESLNAFLLKKDRTNEEYKPSLIRGITDKLPQEDDDEPASGMSDSQQIKFPSWAEEKKAAEKAAEDQGSLAGSEEDSDTVIDPFQIEEEEFFDDLFSDELPGWLTSASTNSAFEDFEEELSQGELPGWVEAMRPVVESTDATGLSEDEDYIENYGPLAGIPSVLPAEAEVAFDPERAARKPLDLFATKNHQDYVNVLKKLITNENKTKTIQKPAPVATQRVLRWLIAIIMLVTTTGTVVFGGIIDTDPPSAAQVQNTGYGALYEQIESLYDGQPVLIAFDYQPASAGELHTAAAGVVDHLMKQGTYLSFISTQPTGPALADHFLATTQEKHEYIHTQQYINLGYLPGESAGLLSFVIAPKKIIPLAFDGSNAWGSPPLLHVDSINDFAMILVITDDPDTAKIWIEQVATILEDTPLNMVISAQAEPLIQPYFRSSPQLVKGYVSGIIDSMNYELLLNRPNLATTAWLPFNLGIIITVGTIFIGGLANGVLSLFSRHRSRAAGVNK